jgi:hypothetical protein
MGRGFRMTWKLAPALPVGKSKSDQGKTKKKKKSKLVVKAMLKYFFDMKEIVHYKLASQKLTVNRTFHLQVLDYLR